MWAILFVHSDGTFYLWETNTWTSEPWSLTSGFVTVINDLDVNFDRI